MTDWQFLSREDVCALPLRERIGWGLHVCRSVFELFSAEYRTASGIELAFIEVESFLEHQWIDKSRYGAAKVRGDLHSDELEGEDEPAYGTWCFAGLALLDDINDGTGWTVTSIDDASQAFAGVQTCRQGLTPFPRVIAHDVTEYLYQLGRPVYRMAYLSFRALLQSRDLRDLESHTLDLTLPRVSPRITGKLRRPAPAAEVENLRRLGLMIE